MSAAAHASEECRRYRIVIAGDLNCNMLACTANSPGQRHRHVMATYGMIIGNTQHPTYRPAGTLLDIVATNRPDKMIRAGVTRCHYGTPHDYTRVALQCTGRTKLTGPVVQRRRLGRIDTESFNLYTCNATSRPLVV